MRHPAWQSLRGRLFAFLLALAAFSALAVGGATYVSVRAEADELFDYHLRQMALSLRDQGLIGENEREALANPDFDYVVQVWSADGLALYSSRPSIPGRAGPPTLPARAVLGYSQVRLADTDWRVFAAATPSRVVQVAQPLTVRRRLATAAALRSVLPVVVAVPVVALGLWWIIGVSLAPLKRVTHAAQARGVERLDALPVEGLPQELQPLVEAFNGLLARLAEAFDTQRQFVADAAHELRTPLTALKLQIGLLQDTPSGPDQEAVVARLRAGVDRAAHLVAQLLALARAEPGATASLSSVDLVDIARQAAADAAPLAARHDAAIGMDTPDTLVVRGDAHALRSALRNLLDNAIKYGGRQVTLAVRASSDGAWLLRVDDDGPGIAPAERERVLGRFQRGEGHDAEGSGLGLAIVAAVARRHGGVLQLGTADSGGLRVEIRSGTGTDT